MVGITSPEKKPATSFKEISRQQGPLLVKFLANRFLNPEDLWFKVKKAWENPKIEVPANDSSWKADIGEKIISVFYKARPKGGNKVIDHAVNLLTGLARVDVVLKSREGQIFSIEAGWDFEKSRVSVEGIKRYPDTFDERGQELSPEDADRFLRGWLSSSS